MKESLKARITHPEREIKMADNDLGTMVRQSSAWRARDELGVLGGFDATYKRTSPPKRRCAVGERNARQTPVGARKERIACSARCCEVTIVSVQDVGPVDVTGEE